MHFWILICILSMNVPMYSYMHLLSRIACMICAPIGKSGILKLTMTSNGRLDGVVQHGCVLYHGSVPEISYQFLSYVFITTSGMADLIL